MQTPIPSPGYRSWLWPVLLIALGALLAYHNTLTVPYVFDDTDTIKRNPSIRDLADLPAVLHPPPSITTSGRPVLNFSLAVNYAISGPEVWSYHVGNLLIHLTAGLVLFGCVRRTLLLPALRPRFGTHAGLLGLLVALLWTVHPLQTESVTYIVQRAESLMGLFYLLTLYCYLRSIDSPAAGRWQWLAIIACALGMGTKEVMVTAPIMVLLHDRAFAAGSFRAAWRQRRFLYVGLALTWFVVFGLVASTGGNRNGSVGFGVGVGWLPYFLTQFDAIATYLQLAVWPHPLIFEYGRFFVEHASELVLPALIVVPPAAVTLWALWRRPGLGFLGGWFFGILAVTCLMPGTTQMIVEHRVYLSLAAVMTGLVLAAYAWLGRRCWVPLAALCVLFGGLTVRRNHDYRSPLALWTDTLEKRPDNVVALSSLGTLLLNDQKPAEALPYFEAAMKLAPGLARQRAQYGMALGRSGRLAESLPYFEEALRQDPTLLEARRNYGAILGRLGRYDEAIAQFNEALRLAPGSAGTYNEIGVTLGRAGRYVEAIDSFKKELALNPGDVRTLSNLGYALWHLGRTEDARSILEEAVRLDPNFADARNNLNRVLTEPAPAAPP